MISSERLEVTDLKDMIFSVLAESYTHSYSLQTALNIVEELEEIFSKTKPKGIKQSRSGSRGNINYFTSEAAKAILSINNAQDLSPDGEAIALWDDDLKFLKPIIRIAFDINLPE